MTVEYTRCESKTTQVAKSTMWIIITQFANMSVIPLLVAQSGEIDAEWYQNVGMNILNTFAMYSLTPNISGIIMPFVTLTLDKTNGMLTAIDQDDYNLKMSGPDLFE